ncbi:MAG: DegT/DnrJ/EryC1/StrS family aminotransferase [Magnetococcales bacterium]|nr:DegT/DnrJ/EryC1/StrS family aminotransferase [Magnetococcales bacterium]
MKPIPTFDYLNQYQNIRTQIQEAIQRVLTSGRLILGPEVEAFEAAFAQFLGESTPGVGVGNGTDALIVALMALFTPSKNDEIITVANAGIPVVSAIRSVGATPVFCDVDPATGLLDIEQLPKHLTPRTRAVVAVHLYGNVVDIPRIRGVIGDSDIPIIEDCAQAHGALLGDQSVGTLGDASAFSFYPTKNLGAYGDGGFCFSRNPEVTRAMGAIRMYGMDSSGQCVREGINSRLDEIQGAVLSVKLKHLPTWIKQRRTLASHYARHLHPKIQTFTTPANVTHGHHLQVIQVENPKGLQKELSAQGIATGIHYPIPVHRMKGYGFLGLPEGSLPETEKLCQKVLSLPLYPEMRLEEVERIALAVNKL